MTINGNGKPIRPTYNPGSTTMVKTGCGKIYVTDCTESEYQEIFVKLGKTGGCPAAFLQAIATLASKGLRQRLTKDDIIQACRGIGCPSPMWSNGQQILSCPDAIAKVLEASSRREESEKGEVKKEELANPSQL